MNTDEYINSDLTYSMQTYARYPIVLKSGSGSRCVDVDGKEYVDFGSGIGVNSLGWCNEGWLRALGTQAITLQHTSNLYANTATVSFTEKLVKACSMKRAFLCNSGTEANECAIKIARKYSFDKYGAGRNVILSLCDSFHGRTLASLAMTGQQELHPDCFAPYPDGFVTCKTTFKDFTSKCDENVCAVIMECVQGEGGVELLDGVFAHWICEYCRERDILVIIDEVQTGIGRTGKLLACENYAIKPDILTLAKGLAGGLPIGACLCGEKTENVLGAGMHGSTFGGNPIACAAAEYVLDTVTGGRFLIDMRSKADYMVQKLREFKNVERVRALGMMIGIRTNKQASDIAESCLEKGLLVLTAKKNTVRLLPALNIGVEDISRGLKILQSVIEE